MLGYNRAILEELYVNPYDDGRPAIWPDTPDGPIDYVIVGEAPGKNEVRKNRIFIGRSGSLLREMVADAGLRRVHYTNSSLHRPTKSLEEPDRPPSAAVIKAERPRLLMEISMLNPKAIIALGATAWEALFGNLPRGRGMVRHLRWLGRSYPTFMTYHPAAILYSPDMYVDIATDLKRAANLDIPEPAPSSFEFASYDTPIEGDIIAVDTESDSAHSGTASILCVTVFDGTNVWRFGPNDLHHLSRMLENYRGSIVGHNSLGDEVILWRNGIPIKFTHDTILHHQTIDERKGSHKLATLGPVYAKKDKALDLIHRHQFSGSTDEDDAKIAFKDIPYDPLTVYCGQDSRVTWYLEQALREEDTKRTRKLYTFLMRCYRAFVEGMKRGILVDTNKLEEALKAQEQAVESIRKRIPFNPNSHPQTLAHLREVGYNVRSSSRDIIDKLEGDLPALLREYRETYKLYSAFLLPLGQWISTDGAVRATYKLHGTDTGRTSCANPNLQQVPESLKHLFVARKGHVFVGWDNNTHEVRGIAYYSQDPTLCNILNTPGVDFHQFLADKIGVERQIAKHSFFAAAYGAGPERIMKSYSITRRQAEDILSQIRTICPRLSTWKESVWEKVWNKGYVETPYGRVRHFYYIDETTASRVERVAVNFLVQSLCNDIALEGAVRLFENTGFPPVLFVHDFCALEVPINRVDEVVEQIQELENTIRADGPVRFLPNVKIGETWGDM